MNEENPSIASQLMQMVQDMKDSLIASITAQTFLDIHGKDWEKFEQGYSDFVNNVRKIEGCICQYLQVGTFYCRWWLITGLLMNRKLII